MLTFLALAVLAQAAAGSPIPKENPAIQAFREACVQGSLKLSANRGRVLDEREITDFMRTWEWGRMKAHPTVVKLTESPSSFLVIVEYKDSQPGSIARSCTLVSKSVSKHEAMAAYLEGLVDKDVHPEWIPDMYLPLWISDHPELGYRKTLEFGSIPAVLLEIGLYPKAAAQMNSSTAKQ